MKKFRTSTYKNKGEKRKYDYLIVGAGFFGAICARELTDRGFKCLVVEKRYHIAGHCYTENRNGINVHVYGPHIFHTSNKAIWDYVNKYAEFNNFVYRPKVFYKGKIYSFPVNLMTLYQLYGVKTPKEAKDKLDEVSIKNDNPANFEEWILSQVGREIYEIFIKGYTLKQWRRDPKTLPVSIIKRLPFRLTFDDNYSFDRYQGIPIGGYTQIFDKLLKGIEVKLNTNYLENREQLNSLAKKIIYTGNIDRFYNYKFGELEYRGLRFEHETLDIPDYQGVAGMNYTDEDVPYTRIVEHKHFEFGTQPVTIITREYPQEAKRSEESFYPINDEKNNKRFLQYKKLADREKNVIFGGRLANYKYYDMHQVIELALNAVKDKLLK